jgi:hypothetical protein
VAWPSNSRPLAQYRRAALEPVAGDFQGICEMFRHFDYSFEHEARDSITDVP